MEQFTLISTIENNTICLRPSSPLISDLIATFKVYENETDLNNFITEQTPLLFEELQSNFTNIASNYYL